MSKKIRILLVDDDKDDFETIRELLSEVRNAVFSIEWISQYEHAKKRMSEGEHDVYLVDYRLGAKTGLELLKEAIQLGCKAPIILLTGYGDDEIDNAAMREGAADYLLKGQITSHLIERTIRYAIYRTQTIQALKEEQDNIRSLLNSIFEGIIITSLDGKILLLNESAARIFGHATEAMLKKDVKTYLNTFDYNETDSSTEDVTHETSYVRSDGTKLSLEVSTKSYFFHGQAARLIAIHDMTQRRELEMQIIYQDRLASVGLLASGLAHEIGTPLGVIRGRAELLEELARSDEVKRNAEVIVAQIDRVSSLIRSLLNLARGDATKNADRVSVNAVINDVLMLMSHEFQRAEIKIENRLSSNINITILGEAEPLHQVFLNLFVNSLHAVKEARALGHHRDFYLRLSAQMQEDHWIISVADNGCGISDANMKNLFKPFFTTKEVGVGTGLGLVNSYRIVSSWGGSMLVESKEGEGAIFKISLPKD